MAKITKVIKGLLPKNLGALGNLEEAKSVGALVPLDKQEVVPSRREFLKKAGSTAAQVALPRGALATLVKEAIKTPPVAKGKVPISTFKNFLTNSIDFRKAVLEDEMSKTPALDNILDENSKINDIDALSDDEVNKLFEIAFYRTPPELEQFVVGDLNSPDWHHAYEEKGIKEGISSEMRVLETELQDHIHDILESTGLSVKDFVTERLQGKEVFPEPEEFPENNLLSSFIDRMKKSGYTDEEITEFLEDSLERYE